MDYKKITAEDIAGKGVVGQADTPLLSALEMQNKVEEVPRAVIIPHFNSLIDSLGKRDADVDTALSDRYTKTETDQAIGDKLTEIGAGDMQKTVYDTDGDGVVDNAAKLGGKTPGQLTFGADQIITDESTDKRLQETLGEKMDKAGGRFTGGISFNTNFGIWFPVNESLQYQFVANEWGFMLQKWVNGVWVQDILSVGGTDEIEIYQNGGANGSGWNFKNISVVKSDWSDVGSKTACIRMLRK